MSTPQDALKAPMAGTYRNRLPIAFYQYHGLGYDPHDPTDPNHPDHAWKKTKPRTTTPAQPTPKAPMFPRPIRSGLDERKAARKTADRERKGTR